MARKNKIVAIVLVVAATLTAFILILGSSTPVQNANLVPHEGKYGIYVLDLATSETNLIYSSNNEIQTSALRINIIEEKFVFAMKIEGSNEKNTEIFTVSVDGTGLNRLTSNTYFDLYPVWSSDGSMIGFLSRRDGDLDIYTMNANGDSQRKLYDSGSNDADIDWKGDTMVFTSMFSIWSMKADGTSPKQITSLPNAGQWGTANLPVGDYDPRLSSNGEKVVFERLENPNSTHGDYDIFTVNIDGSGETRLTNTGYSQGLANWSYEGDKIAYVVAAVNDEGRYDIYLMNSDGTNNHDVTPSYFPTNFLCYSPVFSVDDLKIYFIGVWSD